MKKYHFLIPVSILSCMIMGRSIFDTGSLTLLDYGFTPHQGLNFFQPFGQSFMTGLMMLFGSVIASKLFFFMILSLSGILGYFFARFLSAFFGVSSLWIEMAGIMFFMMNPFAYERMLTQPTVYLSIILLGWGIYFLLSKQASSLRLHMFAGLAFAGALAFSQNALYMIVLIYILYALFFVRSWRGFFYLSLGGSLSTILNANWILASFLGANTTLSKIGNFNTLNLEAFLTRAIAPLDITSTNILLYGFWGEMTHFVSPGILSPYWFIAGFLLFSLITGAIIYSFSHEKLRSFSLFLCSLGVLSLVLGIGIATDWTRPIVEWAYDTLPYFRGYREPQKWIGILMIVEGIFFIIGTSYIFSRIRDIYFRICIASIMLVSFVLWSPGMLWGFRGQLTTTTYPETLFALRSDFLASLPDTKILLLPWHSYMACEWTQGKVIHNSLDVFFSPIEATTADNIEMSNVALYSNSDNPESRAIEDFLRSEGSGGISPLQDRGYTHILVLKKCAEMKNFEWIGAQKLCKKQNEDDQTVLYDCSQEER